MTHQEVISDFKQFLSSHELHLPKEIPDDTPEDDVWDEIYNKQFGEEHQ